LNVVHTERFLGLDYPHVAALLPDQTIQVHNIETQSLVQTISAPPLPPPDEEIDPIKLLASERRAVILSPAGFLVPSLKQSEKLRLKKVRLLGRNAKPGSRVARNATIPASPIDLRDSDGRAMLSVRVANEDASEEQTNGDHRVEPADTTK
jgi:hypothetical protein